MPASSCQSFPEFGTSSYSCTCLGTLALSPFLPYDARRFTRFDAPAGLRPAPAAPDGRRQELFRWEGQRTSHEFVWLAACLRDEWCTTQDGDGVFDCQDPDCYNGQYAQYCVPGGKYCQPHCHTSPVGSIGLGYHPARPPPEMATSCKK
eukprot:COSAG01_NODE_4042_length_5409_cov_25.792844_6_plen_149_part_00